ncbi:MAG TPA: pentapeptide repeat-containing protein [Saprospiraceae bacterium]|nr:pentapeptide repeat-containing protein [Saprospiraceae bacterium]HMQ84529.1 pentapeptide repeat-containing protein [Saprospiraceae bacterium]
MKNKRSEAEIRTALTQIELAVPALPGNRFRSDAFLSKSMDACFFFQTDFSSSDIKAYRFSNCRFQKANFREADLSRSSFFNCIFKATDFTHAQLQEAQFIHCIIEQAILDAADVRGLATEGCFFSDIKWERGLNIGANRILIGLFLSQHAGQSAEKHRIAQLIADETIQPDVLQKSLQDLPLVFKKWIDKICQSNPDSGLESNFRKWGLSFEENLSNVPLDALIWETILPQNFAMLYSQEASYYATTKGQNLIAAQDIRAKLLDHQMDHKYPTQQTAIISVLGEKCPPPTLESIQAIYWPYPPQQTIKVDAWNQKAQEILGQMMLDEQWVSDLICDYLKDQLSRVQTVIDVACSHGLVLQQLHALKPSLHLMGRDIAPEMVAKAAEKLPEADIQVGNALDLGAIKADVVILRATGQAVVSPAEAEKMIQEGLRILQPNGQLIVCSLTPSVLNPARLEAMAKVIQRVKISHKGIAAFYVLMQCAKNDFPIDQSPYPSGHT